MFDDLQRTWSEVISLLAAGVAAGVASDTGRVARAERERELATRRVIGLTRGEAWRLLAGEQLALLLGAPLGGRVRLVDVVAARGDALRAPAMALFRSGDRWAVFAVEAGRARQRPIAVAEQGDGEVAVAAGLAEGAVLVLHPSDRPAEGVRVVAR